MPPSITIRDANFDDAATIVQLVVELAADDELKSPLTESYTKYYLEQPNCFALLAEMDGKVAGLLSYLIKPDLYHASDTCYITELIVTSGFRQRGIGSALVKALLARMEAQGCAEVSVTTLFDNQGAIRFYRRLGLVDEAILLEKHFERLPKA
jgi:ribosomal protein S18 acetylase RimI-like enzyme